MERGESYAGKVVVGHTIYAFNDGGMERGLLNLINYGDHNRFFHVILCLTQAGAFAKQLTSTACEVVELHKRDGNDLRLPIRIAAAARRYRLDILHARGWPALVETVLAARLAGVKATVYGFHGKTMQDLQTISFKRRWVQRMVIRWYQRVMTLNQRMKGNLAAECHLPEDRIDIIPNGVDIHTFYPRKDQGSLRAAFGLPTDRFVIGNVARLDPVKNHEVILKAIRRLRAHACRPFLLLVGEGTHRAVLESEIKTLDLEKDVCVIGYSDQIPELLNCMDLYVQSSFYEGFSNTLLEAMACGLPVVATDVGGTGDLLSEGRQGLFFQPNDDEALASLIVRLYQDCCLRYHMAQLARRHVAENFSVQTVVQRYEAMYLDLATATALRNN